MSYPKLRGAIREKFGTQEAFAKALGLSQTALSAKLTVKTDWSRSEIELACNLLGIPLSQAFEYFRPKN